MIPWLICLLVAGGQDDWQKQEAVHLQNIRQVTRDFVRAGEGYFSPDQKQIIFQAEEKDTGNPFYQIFIMDLDTGKYRRVSSGISFTASLTNNFLSTPGIRSERMRPMTCLLLVSGR